MEQKEQHQNGEKGLSASLIAGDLRGNNGDDA